MPVLTWSAEAARLALVHDGQNRSSPHTRKIKTTIRKLKNEIYEIKFSMEGVLFYSLMLCE